MPGWRVTYFAGMSPVETQFVRLYVLTLRREYALVKSTIDLMHPSGLGLRNFADATRIAKELHEMQKDFDASLSRLQKKHNFRKVNIPDGPTMGELADLFSLSFFKLVTVANKSGNEYAEDLLNGWFSGKPEEWKKTLLSFKDVPKSKGTNLPDLLSDFFQLAMKFFPFHTNKWHLDGHSGYGTKKLWPPENQYSSNDYEDDDEENPFDWLFDDNYDD